MSDKRYSGWTNYETWLVALWADNDEATYRHHQRLAQQTWDASKTDSTFSRREHATLDLAKSLRTEIEDAHPLTDHATLWADLMGAALAEVNWYEIAEQLIQELQSTLPSINKDQ